MNVLAAVNGYYYGGHYGYGWGMDPTYLLAILGFALTLLASMYVHSTFNRYAKMRTVSGLTGATAAERVLHSCGIYDVRIEHIRGNLNDHYDPRTKTLRLSDSTYSASSVAAVCVAAHECGHAVQHQVKYGPLVLRGTLVPIANFGSQLSWPVFFAGLLFSIRPLLIAGIVLFCLAILFQLVTLPVEFNASSRALKILRESRVLPENELKAGRKVLTAAALTYVASLASSLLQLLRLILLSRRSEDRG